MLILNDFGDIQSKLNGKFEDDEFAVKGAFVSVEKTVEMISSFMNSDSKEQGYIIIGVSKTSDKRVNTDDINFVSFPLEVNSQKKGKQKNKCSNLEAYIKAIKDYFNNNTNPKIDLDNYLEIKAINAVNKDSQEGDIILIKIKRYDKSLIQVTKGNVFYARLPQEGANDYGSPPMDGEEVSKRMKSRYYHKENLARPLYYDSKPAVPELTTLFDLIYLGNSKEAEILLEQIPTLTQMTDSRGRNALHIAILYRRDAIADLLVDKHKMSLYHRDNEGFSPLLTAAYVGNLNFVRKLLVNKPEFIRERDRLGNNIFLIAATYGHNELISYLAEKYPVKFSKAKNNSNWNVLDNAVYAGRDENIISLLLTYTNYTSDDFKKALEIAKNYGNSKAENFLEEKIKLLESTAKSQVIHHM